MRPLEHAGGFCVVGSANEGSGARATAITVWSSHKNGEMRRGSKGVQESALEHGFDEAR